MVDLSPMQLVFVQEYIRNGGVGKKAAIAAGYSEKTAESQASRLLSTVKIKEFLKQKEDNLNKDLRDIFVQDAVKAYRVLIEIMEKPDAADKDRLVAARDLLDRAGYKPKDKVEMTGDEGGPLKVVFNIPRPRG